MTFPAKSINRYITTIIYMHHRVISSPLTFATTRLRPELAPPNDIWRKSIQRHVRARTPPLFFTILFFLFIIFRVISIIWIGNFPSQKKVNFEKLLCMTLFPLINANAMFLRQSSYGSMISFTHQPYRSFHSTPPAGVDELHRFELAFRASVSPWTPFASTSAKRLPPDPQKLSARHQKI